MEEKEDKSGDSEDIRMKPTTGYVTELSLKNNEPTTSEVSELNSNSKATTSEVAELILNNNITTTEVAELNSNERPTVSELAKLNLEKILSTKGKSTTKTNIKDKESKDFPTCPHHDTHTIAMYIATIQVELNLTGKIKCIFEPLILPQNLTHLYLSNNNLVQVPESVLKLENIVKIDLSNNRIKYFDETPAFVNKVRDLSLAKNSLLAPPLWVWKDTPRYLNILNLSENMNMVIYLKEHGKTEYFDCWLNICKINLTNCRMHTCIEILYTLLEVKELFIGGGEYTGLRLNELYEFPVDYIRECYNVYSLSLQNCKIYDIHKTINYYIRLRFLDLSLNYITFLPEEIGDLVNLEIFDLSSNKLDSLPNSFLKMHRLRILILTNNRIEYLPENLLFNLPEIQLIDLYDNCLSAIPEGYEKLHAVDFALNYVSEPENVDYIEQRFKVRLNYPTYYEKINGKKVKPPEPTYSDDDDRHIDLMTDEELINDVYEVTLLPNTPVEDWDLDDDEEVAAPVSAEKQDLDGDQEADAPASIDTECEK